MSSCHNSTMLIRPRTSLILRRNPFFFGKSAKFRCVFGPAVPKFTVSASLLTSGNLIAAAAAAGSGTAHGAVTSAITQVAVTAVAIASGACLSTKVDCLWPKIDEQPGSHIDGVDVTGYSIFNDAKAGAKGYCICKESSSWPDEKDRRSLSIPLYSHRKNFSCISPIRW